MKHILIRLYNIVGFTPTAPLCLPQPRTPPPHTKMSDPIPLTSLVFIPLDDHCRTHLFPETFYIYSKDFFSSLAHGTVPHTHIYRICAISYYSFGLRLISWEGYTVRKSTRVQRNLRVFSLENPGVGRGN